jgi:hypothetical protein
LAIRQFQAWVLTLPFLLAAFFALAAGCGPSCSKERKTVVGAPTEKSRLDFIKIHYREHGVLPAGLDANAFVLSIKNTSKKPLENVVLTINDRYKAPLSKMLYYHGFRKGSKPYGSDNLAERSKLEFTFSHDISNHWIFRDKHDKPFAVREILKKLRIESRQGMGEWEFRIGKKKKQ